MVETVASAKFADKLQNQCVSRSRNLDIMVQINSSGEAQKNGVECSKSPDLVKHIREKCPNLNFKGLMTIGSLGASLDKTRDENEDFEAMISCRKLVAEAIDQPAEEIQLSMGMSNDFEKAIAMGSSSVRVGSKIFGARNYPPPK